MQREKKEKNNFAIFFYPGTHGVEAFTGSAIQIEFLREYAVKGGSEKDPTMIFVHPMNPFGMKHLRRTNENNVDLNRNGVFIFTPTPELPDGGWVFLGRMTR